MSKRRANMAQSNKWYKEHENDKVWWLDNPEKIGEFVFSFDKTTEINMFRDYPYKLTEEQKEIFDMENPYWAEFFADRN